MIDAATLRSRIDAFPRLPLGSYPTPLEPLGHLSANLGSAAPSLWIKRDDSIGPAVGGNKTRALEFIVADAVRRHAKRAVTFGGLQSNHARITAAVCRLHRIEPHLLYFARRPTRLTGNLLMCDLLGARMHFIPVGGAGAGMSLESTNRLVRLGSVFLAGPSYFIPVGGHCVLGALGYVRAALELDEQVRALGLSDVTIVTPAGTGGTLAGLVAGLRLVGSPLHVLGIDVGKLWHAFPSSIARLATETCQALGSSCSFSASDIPLILNRYVGVAYGTPSPEGTSAVQRIAECEGIFMDPIYTGKALAGLLDLIAQQRFGPGDNVIFLHTGGTPGLFAFPQTA